MKIFKTGKKEWENKHETFKEKINDLYELANDEALGALDGYNDTTKGLQKILKDAIKNNLSLRTIGAGWSWTRITTATDGLMLDTKPLNSTINISSKSVIPAYKGDPKKLIFAQCGNGIWELSAELRQKKLSLKTTGASNGQTIVGAMSTGAHGSAFDVGGVQDYVVGMHIILSPTRHIWLERKTAPIVSDFFLGKLETVCVQDDDLFNAALVCFGSFGIIHGVMVETEELFLLEGYMRRMPYDNALKKVMETLDFSSANLPCGNERPYHFAVSLNPYDMKKGAFVYSMYKRPYREDYIRHVVDPKGCGPGDDAACFIGKLTQAIPALVPGIVNKLISGALKPYEKIFGTLGEIFNNTGLHGKLLSAAIGIPITHIVKVVDLMLELNKTDGPFVGLIALRFIKKSKATLAFTRYDFTCILELDAAFSTATTKFYKLAWKKLEAEKIPFTFHWGKMNEYTPKRINDMYGKDAVSWIAARNKLLDADGLKVFSNPTLQQWGLDKVLV